MEYFDKKITYLRGLCDGSGFDPDTKEGKIFHGIMDILEDMALDEEETEEPVYFYSFICPNCGEEIDVDEETMETQKEIACPACGNSIPMGTMDIDELKF